MLWFSQRRRLGKLAEEWCEKNGILKCAASYVGFLTLNGLINEDKAREFLNKENHHDQPCDSLCSGDSSS